MVGGKVPRWRWTHRQPGSDLPGPLSPFGVLQVLQVTLAFGRVTVSGLEGA